MVDKLISDINNQLDNWDERSLFSLKNVKNITRADMDMILMYAESFKEQGSFSGLMEPFGNIKKVFEAYNII